MLEGLRKGENVIVHCGRGISRSATVVIAALMVKDGLSYRDARVSRVIFYMFMFMCFDCLRLLQILAGGLETSLHLPQRRLPVATMSLREAR